MAREFAAHTSELLNGTVTDGIRVRTATKGSVAVVGYGVSGQSLTPESIPLTIGRKPASLFLYVAHTLGMDEWGSFLTNQRSTYSLQIGCGDSAKTLLTYDYVRDPPNEYPAAHLHVYGVSDEFDDLASQRKIRTKKLSDLHMPVGGRRFRPSLEDLIEFCVLEDLVDSRPKWADVLTTSRDRYRDQQLAAAVRRAPDQAAKTLRRNGWSAEPPADQDTT